MASIRKLSSGNWRVQIRRKGHYASESFRRRADAESWALEMERRADRGESISVKLRNDIKTFGDMVDLHVEDLREVKKPLRRTKAFALERLKRAFGKVSFDKLTRERLVDYGRLRAKEGAGPSTLGSEISYITTVITHAAAVHGVRASKEQVDLARIALRRLGLVGPSVERDRRPTHAEIEAVLKELNSKPRQLIPAARIVQFAIASAMRQAEICRIRWKDLDERRRTVVIRDRKDPRKKDGNHQRVPLTDLTGYDAWALIQEQKALSHNQEKIFPYDERSVGAAFTRACRSLNIEDLHFHDLRHEATSRLFEAGLPLERVALITGHKDWKMLRRYTHLTPDMLFVRNQQAVRAN